MRNFQAAPRQLGASLLDSSMESNSFHGGSFEDPCPKVRRYAAERVVFLPPKYIVEAGDCGLRARFPIKLRKYIKEVNVYI